MRESEQEGDCEERENRAENRRRRKGSRVGVESKVFEIEVEERKGKPQAIIVERKRGISSWVRLGPSGVLSPVRGCGSGDEDV
ncbi:hypothetical protein CK203_036200 [Vitis vinifera]|uniref:Uncharacterized protein n=1 Tax=Vitis vinifera TaxID=29760 RepID=A0A438IX15_VITVI|nr:hypothetical protein CK203_036200 [Vitis vinifera]